MLFISRPVALVIVQRLRDDEKHNKVSYLALINLYFRVCTVQRFVIPSFLITEVRKFQFIFCRKSVKDPFCAEILKMVVWQPHFSTSGCVILLSMASTQKMVVG